ncbi:MAG TPA: hypothetical protein VMW87_07730 [Spirochaetia bacterium]|nr:hypothetical protein [Spirochaetia bacterium]
MAGEQPIFSENVLKDYMNLHAVVVEMKYSFLKLVLSPSATEAMKQELKERLIAIADLINTHFVALAGKDVNSFNLDDFERREQIFARQVRSSAEQFLKTVAKISPVRIKYSADPVAEKTIDEKLSEARIFDHPALERQKIDSLGHFERYLLDRVYVPAAKDEKLERTAKVEKELLELKVRNFVDRLVGLHPENPDILFKMSAKLENAASHGARVNVVAGVERALDDRLNSNELYIKVDDRYNVSIFYNQDNARLELTILLAESVSADGIAYAGTIEGETRVGVNRVHVLVRDPVASGERGRMTLDEYRAAYQRFLELTDLDRLYRFCLAMVQKHRGDEAEKSRRVDEEMKNRVSNALDDLL